MILKLLYPDKKMLQYVAPVTTTATVKGKDVEPEGLFSTQIFGPIGSDERMSRFSYIDLNSKIIHPRLYRNLRKLSSLYRDIMDSKIKVKFVKGKYELDDKGKTGYSYFISNLPDLKVEGSDSPARQEMIKSFNRYQKEGKLLNKYLYVLPAGLRDITIEQDGRVTTDDLNDHYKRCLTASQMMNSDIGGEVYDRYLLSLQNKVEELMNEVYLRMKGKKGFIGKNIAGKKIDYGTANVISGASVVIEDLELEKHDRMSEFGMGMLQYAKSVEPLIRHHIKTIFGEDTYDLIQSSCKAFTETGESITVTLKDKDIEHYMTSKGITSIINKHRNYAYRDKQMYVEDRLTKKKAYPYIVKCDYSEEIPKFDIILGDGKVDTTLDFFLDKDPKEGIYNRPITNGELLFLACSEEMKEAYGTMSRHPVSDEGSIVAIKYRIDSTVESVNTNVRYIKEEINVDGSPSTNTLNYDLIERYPILGKAWQESLNPNYGLAGGFRLDYDG